MVRFFSKRRSDGGERRERDLLRQVRRRCHATDAGEEKDGGGGGRKGVRMRTTARFRWERKYRTEKVNEKRQNSNITSKTEKTVKLK